MYKQTLATLVVALGCIVPYAAPFSVARGLNRGLNRLQRQPAVTAGFGRGRLSAAAAPVRRLGWNSAAVVRGRGAVLRMVNAEMLQSVDSVELDKMKVAELKELCDACGLGKTGKKADLIARILELQAATAAPGFPAAAGEAGAGWDDDELEFQAAEDLEPGEVYGMANPAPARMFDYNGQALVQGKLPELANGANRFVAQPRTGNCWHGLYFDIHAKDKPITVTAVRTASSPEGSAPIREDKMNLWVYTCEGSMVGQELSQEAWTLRGEELGIQLPVVSYGESEPFYGAVPLNDPLEIKAGGTVGVCLFASSWRGVVLRAKLGEAAGWKAGDVTDENSDLSLHAGILPKNDDMYADTMFTKLYKPIMANAFVGAIEYTVK